MRNAAGNDCDLAGLDVEAFLDELETARAAQADDQVGVEVEVEAGMLHDVVAQFRDVQPIFAGIDFLQAIAQDAFAERTEVLFTRAADVGWSHT